MLVTGRTEPSIDAGFKPFDVLTTIAGIECADGVVSDWSGHSIDLNWNGKR
jgi:fructose-1,6-bisphosphatase/inositol monophosphatase family enzyme